MECPSKLDEQVMRSLIHQVMLATPPGHSEKAVVTFVSRPMWIRWCRATQQPLKPIRPIYGSTVMLVESEKEFSFSKAGFVLNDQK